MSTPLPRSVRIGRLVLTGIEPHHRAAVVESFRAELARLLAQWPDRVPPHPARIPGTAPADIGRRVAAEVHAKVVAAC